MEFQTQFFPGPTKVLGAGFNEFGVKKNWFLTVKKVVSV